jgi:Intron-binding protein aquarius N-terminus
LQAIPKWRKYWKLLQKKDAKEPEEVLKKLNFERRFLKNMIEKYLNILYQIQVRTGLININTLLTKCSEEVRKKMTIL